MCTREGYQTLWGKNNNNVFSKISNPLWQKMGEQLQNKFHAEDVQKDLDTKAAIPNLTDTSVGSADNDTATSRRRRNYTSLYVCSSGTGANM